MGAELVHLLLIEHVGIEHGAGKERADHEVQARPVCGETRDAQPDESGIPAITLGDAPHHFADEEGHKPEDDKKTELTSDTVPIEQDDREHAPDGDVVETGVTQNALADRLAQDAELFHEEHQDRESGDRAGHADADDKLPGMTL